MGTNLVKHGKFELKSAEEMRAALPVTAANTWKPEVGRNVIRFLPPPLGKTNPFRISHQHFLDTPAGRVAFTCPRMEARKPCPACSKYESLSRSGNPIDRKAADDWKPKQRVYANVIDRKNPEAGPKVFGFSSGILKDLLAIREDEEVGGDFTDSETGFDIVIEREGAGKNDTRYKVFPTKNNKPIGNPSWLEAAHDLDAFASVKGPEEIERMLRGASEDTEDESAPSSKSSGTTKKKRSAADDVVDPEAEDDVQC